KHFDELSKALANGVSRRSALKRFAAGVAGAALASVLPGRKAAAQIEGRDCKDICGELGLQREAYAQCVSECAACIRRGGDFIIPILCDHAAFGWSSARASKAVSIQAQPHSCRTRAGSASRSSRKASTALTLASRVA